MSELLSLLDVCASYEYGGQRTQVLKSVSLEMAFGEIVGISGPGGAGRTTLLRVVAGMMPSDGGQVKLEGVDLAGLSYRKRLRFLGDRILWIDWFAPPDVGTVRDYIVRPLLFRRHTRKEAVRLAWEALERVDGSSLGMRQPTTLTTWEKLLVGLARAVAIRPRLVLIDGIFDAFGVRRMVEAGRLLCSVVDTLGCGFLLSVPDSEEALPMDCVWRLSEGGLTRVSVRATIVALASELHERGYKDAAAVITGSTLEEHLRKLAVQGGIPTERGDGSPQKADALNNALASTGAYNRLQQKGVTAWLDIRNKAAHGQYSEYDAAQVSALIRDVESFMHRFPVGAR